VTCATEVIPIHQIPVVCEFPDVFPDELPGLRQIWILSLELS
jgi:hypothetical protein